MIAPGLRRLQAAHVMPRTVGIIASRFEANGVTAQRAAESYVLAVGRMTGAVPLLIPSVPEASDVGHLVDVLDGIVLTGARANIHPEEWGEAETDAHPPFDRNRDRVALPLVRAAVAAGVPLLGICRGLQEMNVAFGGTLHPEIRDLPGRMNHRMPKGDPPRAEIFRPRHCVHLIPGGTFAQIYGATEIFTNSLHGQAICDPAERLVIEGRADDTTIEAISIAGAAGFALGVQWHPEYEPWDQPVNAVLWQAFRSAIDGSGWRTRQL